MEKRKLKRIANLGIVLITVGILFTFGSSAHAASNKDDHNHHHHHIEKASRSKPKLDNVAAVSKSSVALDFRDRKFSSQTATAVVSVKNKSTGVLVEKAYKVTLNDRGDGTVVVKGLKSGVNYQFKVRLIKASSGKSTQNSADKRFMT